MASTLTTRVHLVAITEHMEHRFHIGQRVHLASCVCGEPGVVRSVGFRVLVFWPDLNIETDLPADRYEAAEDGYGAMPPLSVPSTEGAVQLRLVA